jgi:hypothetical protein
MLGLYENFVLRMKKEKGIENCQIHRKITSRDLPEHRRRHVIEIKFCVLRRRNNKAP